MCQAPTPVLRVLISVVFAVLLAATSEARAATVRVDRDRMQCPHAQFTSIQTAVDAASAGDTIKVCPDVYHESVTVAKTLTLMGRPDTVVGLDCFDPTPSHLGDGDPTRQVIVDGSGLSAQQLFDLQADGIVLEGFVLQGAATTPRPTDHRLFRRAVNTSDQYGGYRIRRNLFRRNTVGAQIGSDGSAESRVDGNCLRENAWGVGSDDRRLIGARIDHNATFRHEQIALAPDLPLELRDISLDHNRSLQDQRAIWITDAHDARIAHNDIRQAGLMGIRIDGANRRLRLAHNHVLGGGGIGLTVLGSVIDSRIANNVLTGNMATGINLVGGAGTTVAHNLVNDNGNNGIVLGASFTGGHIRDNDVNRNGRHGIVATPGATGHRIEHNTMLGNGAVILTGVDARDDNTPLNDWTRNRCVSDTPPGLICRPEMESPR